jgi:hypothetical protein
MKSNADCRQLRGRTRQRSRTVQGARYRYLPDRQAYHHHWRGAINRLKRILRRSLPSRNQMLLHLTEFQTAVLVYQRCGRHSVLTLRAPAVRKKTQLPLDLPLAVSCFAWAARDLVEKLL